MPREDNPQATEECLTRQVRSKCRRPSTIPTYHQVHPSERRALAPQHGGVDCGAETATEVRDGTVSPIGSTCVSNGAFLGDGYVLLTKRYAGFCVIAISGASLDAVTITNVDAFLKDQASRGWSRKSLHGSAVGCEVFSATPRIRDGVDPISRAVSELPRLYALEDVPRAPSTEQIDRLLEDTASSDDPVNSPRSRDSVAVDPLRPAARGSRAADLGRSGLGGRDDPRHPAEDAPSTKLSNVGASW